MTIETRITLMYFGLFAALVLLLVAGEPWLKVSPSDAQLARDTERAVLELLWSRERFAERANAVRGGSDLNTGLTADELARDVGRYDVYAVIADMERRERIYLWSDGRYHLWREE